MPTPARTSIGEIVAAGRSILEREGFAALTIQAVAQAVGVRGPSLYKRIDDRDELIRLIADDVMRDLGAELEAAASTGDGVRDLQAIASAFRAFARAHPAGYSLLFGPIPDSWRSEPDPNAAALRPLFAAVESLAGPEQRLEAARTVASWAHGFISMELAGAFRLGGDVDLAFEYGIARIAAAIRGDGQGTAST